MEEAEQSNNPNEDELYRDSIRKYRRLGEDLVEDFWLGLQR